jgi:hypothetical protein
MTFVDGPGGKPLGPAPRSVRCERTRAGACVPDDDGESDHGEKSEHD